MFYPLLTIFFCFMLATGMLNGITRPSETNIPDTIKAQGYGGDIKIAVTTDATGKIQSMKALSHNETTSLVGDLNIFFQQFIGKTAQDPLILGKDIDGITGATVTSSGITHAVQDLLAKKPPSPAPLPHHDALLITTSALSLLAATAFILKNSFLRWTCMLGGSLLLGFHFKSMLSISHVINLSLPTSSPPSLNTLWLIPLAAGFLPAILIGRLYCGSLCPFAWVQEILFKIFPRRFRPSTLSPATQKRTKWIKYILAVILTATCVALKNSAPSSIEPFITLFTGNGSIVAWSLLCLMLFMSLFYFRFWCLTLCPVGALTGLASRFSLFKITPSSQSSACDKCIRTCPTNAISQSPSGIISVDHAECILCGNCLKGCPNSCFKVKCRYVKN